ncbi:MAG: tetratricopeptide repeat protein [Bryobacterales bacterium]|nr:tetratricopeptide repeat protein [Bryobacterales bacterium]
MKNLYIVVVFTLTMAAADSEKQLAEARRLFYEEAYPESVSAFKAALEIATRAQHPAASIAVIRCELGYSLSFVREDAAAVSEMSNALQVLRAAGVPTAVAGCAQFLARHYAGAGNFRESRRLIAEAIAIEESKPERVEYLVTALNDLARFEVLAGSREGAESCLPRLKYILEGHSGRMRREVALRAYTTLALLCRYLYRREEAIRYAERAVALGSGTAGGPHHRELMWSLYVLASSNVELMRLRRAGEWASRIEAGLKEYAVTDAEARLETLVTLGYVASARGELERAVLFLEEARDLIGKLKHPDPLTVGTLWTHLGRVHRRRKDFPASEQCHKNALQVLTKAFSERHYLTGVAWLDLAGTYRLMKRYDDSIACYRNGFAIVEEFSGRDGVNLGADYSNFAGLLRKTRRKEEARKYEALAEKARSGSVMGLTVDVDEWKGKGSLR